MISTDIGSHVAEIGRDHRDAAGPRLFGGDKVMRPPVAVNDQVGHRMLFEQFSDKAAPLVEPAAEVGRRQAPEKLVAEMQVDAVYPVAVRDQRPAELVEEMGNRPLQKQERARPQGSDVMDE